MPIFNLTYNQDIFFVLITISFLLIAILKGMYWKHAKLLFMGVFARRYSNQFLREENVFTERVNILTSLIMLINFTLIFVKLLMKDDISSILIVFTSIGSYFLGRIIIIRLLGSLFHLEEVSKLAVFFSLLFDKTLGFLISPLVLCIYFFAFDISHIFILTVLFISSILLLLKIAWLWWIGANSFGLSKFYIFLYLCLLEISPILLFVKEVFY